MLVTFKDCRVYNLQRCSIFMQLSSIKKFIFHILSRFLPNREAVDRVRATFTGLYTLDPVNE